MIRVLGWLWLIIIGYIMVTPVGPICLSCGVAVSKTTIMILGVISIVLGLAGFVTAKSGAANKAAGR